MNCDSLTVDRVLFPRPPSSPLTANICAIYQQFQPKTLKIFFRSRLRPTGVLQKHRDQGALRGGRFHYCRVDAPDADHVG